MEEGLREKAGKFGVGPEAGTVGEAREDKKGHPSIFEGKNPIEGEDPSTGGNISPHWKTY